MNKLIMCLGLSVLVLGACGGMESEADPTHSMAEPVSDPMLTKPTVDVPKTERTLTDAAPLTIENTFIPTIIPTGESDHPVEIPPTVESMAAAEILPTVETTSVPTTVPRVESTLPPEIPPTQVSIPMATDTSSNGNNPAARADSDPVTPMISQSESVSVTAEPTYTHRRSEVPEFSNEPAPDFTIPLPSGTFSESTTIAFSKALVHEFEATTERMGISAAIYTSGMSWSEAIGVAEPGIPMTSQTPLRLMSSSKTFLGALILSQAAAGLYSLDDHVSTLLANHSGYRTLDAAVIQDVTVRELLTMRSGMFGEDILSVEGFMVMANPTWEPVDSLRLVKKEAESPGAYRYLDIVNSFLLGMVAEEMGDSDLLSLYRRHFLDSLGIKVGFLPMTVTPSSIAKPYADRSRYGGTGGFGDLTKIPMYTSYGLDFFQADGRLSWAGAGIISTPENIARWGYELMSDNGRALPSGVGKQLTESFVDEWISLIERRQKYGFHLVLTENILSDGSAIFSYGHPGGGSGFASYLLYSPSLDVSISILANTEINSLPGSCESPTRRGVNLGLNPMSCIALDFFEALIEENGG